MNRKRILIVGGVAGGASCAARARRLSEAAEIVIFDRGPFVSFANCGLPYYVGNVIRKEENLLVASPELFRDRFNIEVRLNTEVLGIDPREKRIRLKDLISGGTGDEAYDALVLSPGAAPIRPEIPGIGLPGIFSLRTIPDSRAIKAWIEGRRAARALVVGGGYIGLEITENLARLGLAVTLVEMQPQVLPLLDPEMAAPLHEELRRQRVELRLADSVEGFAAGPEGGLLVSLKSGAALAADLVILAIGVRPETGLARSAGLAIGERGGIRVDAQMRTSDPHIWAVGDAVEVRDAVTGRHAVIPLAGPANRQGRIAADVIMGRNSVFRGVQGTSVLGVFDLVAAFTGPSEKTLRRLGLWTADGPFEKIHLHPGHHAGYYPGANEISIKLIFNRKDGLIVSAQAVGKAGVEKRIDVISMAIQKGGTVFDLEEAELCYAPQFGSAKDPVNLAGMIAANVLRGDLQIAHWGEAGIENAVLLDVREPIEFKKGHVAGAVHMPLNEVRARMAELPRDRGIRTYCYGGQRSYIAARTLQQSGFGVKNMSGGHRTFEHGKAFQNPGKRQV
jgi:NADPH-dependent 2,4-dienoyl-CoA reductase/sulfur reductase-like enzyme/rhodanese-related sulfurtransferase